MFSSVSPVQSKSRGTQEAGELKMRPLRQLSALGVSSSTEDASYFVKMRVGAPDPASSALTGLGVVVVDRFPQANTLVLESAGDISERAAVDRQAVVAALSALPGVEWAEKGRPLQALATPNDPGYGAQWGLPATGFPKAWDTTVGEADIVVAVLDSGIAQDIAELADKVVEPYSTLHETSEAWAWEDVFGHGSGVAAVALAQGNDGQGIAGAAWDVSLMPVHFTDDGTVMSPDFVEAIYYAVDHGADVINISYGSDSPVTAEREAIQYALGRGVVVVASAGNGGSTAAIQYPAAFPGVIAVTATDQQNGHAGFSAKGVQADLAAPGQDILTYWATEDALGLAVQEGTSFAAPLVAGAAALLLSCRPGMAPAEVEEVLEGTATDLGVSGADPYFGNGLLDIGAAVQEVSPVTTSSTVPPTTATTAPGTTSTTVPGPASPFPDVDLRHPYFEAIVGLAQRGVINGRPDGTFGASDPLMRAQLAKMTCGALGIDVQEYMTAPFQDLGQDDPATLYPHDFIAAAEAEGIMVGVVPGYFQPWGVLTRAQAVTVVVRALQALRPGVLEVPAPSFEPRIGFFNATHYPALRLAEYNGLLGGLLGYGLGWDPWAAATRGEVADMLWRGVSLHR